MKTQILSILLLASVTAFALPNEGKKVEKANPNTVAVTGSISTLPLQQLQDENTQLKMQLVSILNENEELKGQLSYQTVMSNMFSKLGEQKLKDQMEEMQAQIDYNRMMSNMFLKLRSAEIK